MNSKSLILSAVVVYILTSVVSYFAFATLVFSKGGAFAPIPQVAKDKEGKVVFDTTLPKTESCPLNGVKYSKQQKQWWEKHRPLGVMIENHTEARPQSGLSSADIVYEAIAEGGITRFLSVFYCQDAEFVGPVRSARTYFVDFISEYGSSPLYAHVGGANTPGPADALGQISDYGWSGHNDLNQFSIGFPVFKQDKDRLIGKDGGEIAIEHTMYTSPSKLWEYASSKRKLTNVDEEGVSWDEGYVPYKFKDEQSLEGRPESEIVSFDFWDGYKDFGVKWTYDKATNTYLRENGGVKHIDKNTGKQLSAKNIVILFMTERRANDGYENNLHMLYGTKGKGNAIVFMDGKKTLATWTKKDRTSRTILTNRSTGEEIQFDAGNIWFCLLSVGTDINES